MSFPERTSPVAVPERMSGASTSAATASTDQSAWMRFLSEHFDGVRHRHPDDELCIVFDIDGTILDLRHLVVHVLLASDRDRGTGLFVGLIPSDITHHEDDVDRLLASLSVPEAEREDVASFYRSHLWDREAILAASKPYEGVFGVIRWFQLQPRTHVALNTGRPHRMRDETLESLNTIGREYRVRFDPDLLFTATEGVSIPAGKAAVIEEIGRRGFRVVAAVDNEPENLRAMAAIDPGGDIAFLHADTISRSQRFRHDRSVTGRGYRLREFVPQGSIPSRVEFVWHGVNDGVNLERFLDSDVRWAEIDVRRDPVGRLVLRHDDFVEMPWRRDESPLLTAHTIDRLFDAGRSVKLDLKEGGATLAETVDMVVRAGVRDDRVWFNAELPSLGAHGFSAIRKRFPRSTMSTPVDFLVPLLLAAETAVDDTLQLLRGWGVSRLSLAWSPLARRCVDLLETKGWEVNLYGIPDLEVFLEASLLLPTSITADFNFPEWGYLGRGSGANGVVHVYEG